jgi:hypothetical protein
MSAYSDNLTPVPNQTIYIVSDADIFMAKFLRTQEYTYEDKQRNPNSHLKVGDHYYVVEFFQTDYQSIPKGMQAVDPCEVHLSVESAQYERGLAAYYCMGRNNASRASRFALRPTYH